MSLLGAFMKNIVILFAGIYLIAFLAKSISGASRLILPEALVYMVFMPGTLTVLGGYGLLSLSGSLYSGIKV